MQHKEHCNSCESNRGDTHDGPRCRSYARNVSWAMNESIDMFRRNRVNSIFLLAAALPVISCLILDRGMLGSTTFSVWVVDAISICSASSLAALNGLTPGPLKVSPSSVDHPASRLARVPTLYRGTRQNREWSVTREVADRFCLMSAAWAAGGALSFLEEEKCIRYFAWP